MHPAGSGQGDKRNTSLPQRSRDKRKCWTRTWLLSRSMDPPKYRYTQIRLITCAHLTCTVRLRRGTNVPCPDRGLFAADNPASESHTNFPTSHSLRHACYWTMDLKVSTLTAHQDRIARQQVFLQAAGNKNSKPSISTDATLLPLISPPWRSSPGSLSRSLQRSRAQVTLDVTSPCGSSPHRSSVAFPGSFPPLIPGKFSSSDLLARDYPAPVSPGAHTWVRAGHRIGEYATTGPGAIIAVACM